MAWQIEQDERDPRNGTFDWEWEEDSDAYEAVVIHSPGEYRKAVKWDEWKRASGADRNPDIARGMHVALRRRR